MVIRLHTPNQMTQMDSQLGEKSMSRFSQPAVLKTGKMCDSPLDLLNKITFIRSWKQWEQPTKKIE